MSKNQSVENSIDAVLSDINYWYETVLLGLIADEPISKPFDDNVLLDVIKNLDESRQEEAISLVKADKSELDAAVLKIMNLSADDNKKECVQAFMDIYRRMVSRMRYYVRSDNSSKKLDPDTGLQKQGDIPASYKVEMERLCRHKEPFAICLLRCDPIWHKDTTKTEEVIKATSSVILSNLRVFDDAYRLDDDYILVLLKHTKDVGGIIFFERVQRQLDSLEKIDDARVTASACIAAPFEGQKLDELLTDMRKDLDETCKDVRDDYITILETTDLQKFLGSDK